MRKPIRRASRRFVMAFAAVAAFSIPANAAKMEGRLSGPVVPVSQAIELRLDPAESGYLGAVRIALDVRESASSFRLHSEGHHFTALSLERGGEVLAATQRPVADDLVEILPERPLTPGRWHLAIDFTAEFGTRAVGLYRVEHEGESYAFTQFEADDAREAFPAWDEPAFKIPFELTLTVPRDLVAVSNTPIESGAESEGWKTVRFRETKPLPTYLLAIAVGPFDVTPMPGLGVPGNVIVPRGKADLTSTVTAITPDLLGALEEYFGRPYPYAKLDFIAVPEYWPGAMEHPGAITYRDAILLVDPDAASVAQRRSLARIVGHELAHQWFGNLVTMEWWDDLWLNEAFADWMGDKVTERVHPEFRLELTELQGSQRFFDGDARPSAKPIRQPVSNAGNLLENVGLTYHKGKLVLGMFESWAGPERFRQGIRRYMEENAWGSAVADDLWRALDSTTGRDVSGAMTGFLEQPGFPLVHADVLPGGRVRLTQRRFANSGVDLPDQTWRVPVVLRYSDGATVGTASLLLENRAQEFEVAPGRELSWVHPNGGGAGYYRWSLPSGDLARLARIAPEVLSARERVEFLGNLGALLDAGRISAETYLESLSAFGRDAEPLVVGSAFAAMNGMRDVFETEANREALAAWARRAAAPALERFGLEARPGEEQAVSLFRPRLLAMLGDWGRDPDVTRQARRLALSWLEDPGSIDPSLAAVALQVAAGPGDAELFDRYRERFEAAAVPADRGRLLSALGSFDDPALQHRALAYSLEGPLTSNEVTTVPFALMGSDASRDLLLEWTIANFEAIRERIPPVYVRFLPSAAGGCSRERLERAREFFSGDRLLPGMASVLERMEHQVRDCAALREREEASVAAFLDRVAEEYLAGPN